jgi:hypothetical protein
MPTAPPYSIGPTSRTRSGATNVRLRSACRCSLRTKRRSRRAATSSTVAVRCRARRSFAASMDSSAGRSCSLATPPRWIGRSASTQSPESTTPWSRASRAEAVVRPAHPAPQPSNRCAAPSEGPSLRDARRRFRESTGDRNAKLEHTGTDMGPRRQGDEARRHGDACADAGLAAPSRIAALLMGCWATPGSHRRQSRHPRMHQHQAAIEDRRVGCLSRPRSPMPSRCFARFGAPHARIGPVPTV